VKPVIYVFVTKSEVIHPVEYEDDDPSAAYATGYTPEERREAERRYWMQSQHSLGNALSLVSRVSRWHSGDAFLQYPLIF